MDNHNTSAPILDATNLLILITMDGRIELIIGPMNSGKTTELIRRVRRHQIAKKSCLVIKYIKDTRYGDHNQIFSHDALMIEAKSFERLEHANVDKYDVIGIDEGQFFPQLALKVVEWADAGKIVIVAALDATFNRLPFGCVHELISQAESVEKLTAVCMDCGNNASFTARTIDSKELVVVGGEEAYKSLCRHCFLQHLNI